MHFLPFVILFSLLSCVSCAQVNVTIDDTYGNSNTGAAIAYYPPDAWQAGQSCGNCTANVDASQTYDNSWHDATYNPVGGTSNAYPGTIISASVSFTGSAVYVYCILTGSSSSPDGNTDMTFLIDGSSAGSFSRAANGDNSYAYNQVVFGTSSLTQGQHNLTIQSGHGGTKALVLLDRIVYTTDESDVTTTLAPATTSSTSSSSSSSSSLESSTQQTTGSPSSSASSTFISPTSTTALTTSATAPSTSSGDSNLPSISFSQPAASSSSSSDAAAGSSSSHSHSTGTIVGAVLGSVGGILIALLLWWLLARRKRLPAAEDDAGRAVQPFFGRPRAMSSTTGSFGNDATFLTLQHSTSAHSPVTPTVDGTSATSPETPAAVRARFNAYAALERPPNTHADNARLVPPSPPAAAAAAAAAAAGPSHAVYSRPLPLPKVSPFSPTPLYAPTNNLSPTTASGSNGSTNGRNLSNVALLRPNRRHDPGPYSRVGRTGVGAGARAEEGDEEDSESDVRWQRKIVNVFTPSARRRSLPTPPLLPGEPPLPPPPPVGVPASRPTPPPPYHPQRSGRL